jgi:sugar O-acyltransferase (sialic acid O-acetyltransferase NeuD family)
MEDILLIGGGGHCRSVLNSIKKLGNYNIVGILDTEDKVGKGIDGIKIIGTDEKMECLFFSGVKNAVITVGSIGNTGLRTELYNKLKGIGFNLPIIIDKTAIVDDNTILKEGIFVGKGAIINAGTTIEKCSIINSRAIVEHDCKIGEFVHLAPGSVLCGGVKIGDNTHIGANTTIIQGIEIGDNTLIGAGSVVVKDTGSFKKAYGNPCKEVVK